MIHFLNIAQSSVWQLNLIITQSSITSYCTQHNNEKGRNKAELNSQKTPHRSHRSMHFGIYIDGLVHDCSNSIALAMELLQSCTEPSIYGIKLISDAISSINFREKWTWLEDLIVFSYLLLVFKFEEEVTLDEEKSLPKRLKVNNDVAFTVVLGSKWLLGGYFRNAYKLFLRALKISTFVDMYHSKFRKDFLCGIS